MSVSFPALLRRGAMIAVLAIIPTVSLAKSPYPAWQWINHYYEDPNPHQFVPAVFELSRNGFFDAPGQIPLGIGFFATLFRENPDKIDEWLRLCRVLPEQELRLIISALWYSGHPKGTEYLEMYVERLPDSPWRNQVKTMLESTSSFDSSEVDSIRSLYAKWGVFLATGDPAPLHQIFAGLGTQHDGISQNDLWWFACAASHHDRVLEFCRDELASQPAAAQNVIGLILHAREKLHDS